MRMRASESTGSPRTTASCICSDLRSNVAACLIRERSASLRSPSNSASKLWTRSLKRRPERDRPSVFANSRVPLLTLLRVVARPSTFFVRCACIRCLCHSDSKRSDNAGVIFGEKRDGVTNRRPLYRAARSAGRSRTAHRRRRDRQRRRTSGRDDSVCGAMRCRPAVSLECRPGQPARNVNRNLMVRLVLVHYLSNVPPRLAQYRPQEKIGAYSCW
jgi:hypothetical protein